MPELPDVETFRRTFDLAIGRRLEEIEILRRPIVRRTTPEELSRALRGRTIRDSRRHGKYLFGLTDGPALVLHFGMTGFLTWEEGSVDTRAVLHFDRGRLAYVNRRMIGGISFTDDVHAFLVDRGLGPDALEVEELPPKRGAIKAALMDQSWIAGIGNVYADEILFQLRAHPAQDISTVDTERLLETIRFVLEQAIEARADVKKMPGSWLLPHRHPNGRCPRDGRRLRRIKFQGRSAYVCSKCQPLRASVSPKAYRRPG